MLCPNCGKANEDGAKFCNACGKEFKAEKKAIICPSCGTEYSEMATFCGICGKALPKIAESVKPATVATSAERRCKWCGAPAGAYDIECPTCKRDLRWSAESVYSDYGSSGEEMYTTESSSQTSAPVIGGVLLIIAGVLGLFEAFIVLALGGAVAVAGSGFVTCCGLLMLLFALAGIVGGFFATTRSHFVLAILGGVLVMGCIGPIFLSVILGLIGLLLVAVSKDQFD